MHHEHGQHNQGAQRQDIEQGKNNRSKHDKTWNCRDQAACPVENYCLKNNVVYKATVEYDDKKQHYIGMKENSFKTRYTLHKSSFKQSTKRKQTELSNLIWTLKDSHTEYKLTWSIIDHTSLENAHVTCVSQRNSILSLARISSTGKPSC